MKGTDVVPGLEERVAKGRDGQGNNQKPAGDAGEVCDEPLGPTRVWGAQQLTE